MPPTLFSPPPSIFGRLLIFLRGKRPVSLPLLFGQEEEQPTMFGHGITAAALPLGGKGHLLTAGRKTLGFPRGRGDLVEKQKS